MFDPSYGGEITSRNFIDNDLIHPGMDPRDLEHVRALYDGEIAYTDYYLGLLFEELHNRGLYDNAVIVLTSDHGDEFFEHGQKGHRANLYNSTLRVPLLIKFPENRGAGSRINTAVSLVDIAPTLADFVDSDRLATSNGKSLLSLIRGGEDLDSRVAFADLAGRNKAMISGDWKIVTGMGSGDAVEMYDLATDAGEIVNVIGENRVKSEEMLAELQAWLNVADRQARSLESESFEYDDETRLTLEALGYLD